MLIALQGSEKNICLSKRHRFLDISGLLIIVCIEDTRLYSLIFEKFALDISGLGVCEIRICKLRKINDTDMIMK